MHAVTWVAPLASVILGAAIAQRAETRLVVRSTKAGHEIPFVAFGGGGTLHLLGGKGRSVADTIWATTPADVSVDLLRGEVKVLSGDSTWIALEVNAGTGARLGFSGPRALLKQSAGEVSVGGYHP